MKSVPGGSLTSPDSCDSSRRIVTAPIVSGLALSASSGTHLTTGSSRWSLPASRSWRIAVPVKVLVMEAIRYSTPGPARRPAPRSANPTPLDQTSSPPWTMPAAAPYSLFSRTNEPSFASNCSAPPATGPVISLLPSVIQTSAEVSHPTAASAALAAPRVPARSNRSSGTPRILGLTVSDLVFAAHRHDPYCAADPHKREQGAV